MARTVTALAGEDVVTFAHVSEALSLRAGGRWSCPRRPRSACPRRPTPLRWPQPSIGPPPCAPGWLEPPLGGLAAHPGRVGRVAHDVARIWEAHAAARHHGPDGRHPRARPGWPRTRRHRRSSSHGRATVSAELRRWRWSPRAPTRYGIGVAAQLGADLSAAGVSVVPGLPRVDGAAHEGACGAGAPPIGVVAGGLDDPYPRRHARLWARVPRTGPPSPITGGLPH